MSNITITPGSRLADISARMSADLVGQSNTDRYRRRLHLEAAITFAALGGHNSQELIDASTEYGGKPNTTGWPGHWLMAGLTGTDWHAFDKNGAEWKERKDQLQWRASVIKASLYLADGEEKLSKLTIDELDAKFDGPFQTAVRKAVAQFAKGEKKAPSGDLSEDDITGEDESRKAQAERDLAAKLKRFIPIAELTDFRPVATSEVLTLICVQDETGWHVVREAKPDVGAINALLSEPNLADVDGTLNGVCEHLLLTQALLPNRPSLLPEDAADGTVVAGTPMRVSGRTTMQRGPRLDTSLSHVTAPAILVVSDLFEGEVLPSGPNVLLASSRAKFESDVVPAENRQHYEAPILNYSGKLFALSFSRKRSSKPANLSLIPADEWGTSKFRNPFAFRLSANYIPVVPRPLGWGDTQRLATDFLRQKDAGSEKPLEVHLDGAKVTLSIGKGAKVIFDCETVDSKAPGLKFSVPAREFTEVMLLAAEAAVDDLLTIGGDARGVLDIRFDGRGGSHAILIASLLADGSRSSGDLFQRYDKTCA
jgi:hypothetical protein